MAPKAKQPACTYDGPMEGDGTFYYASGSTYTGQWKMRMPPDDALAADGSALKPTRLRHGKGVFKDGQYSYVGDWDEDAMHGQGTFVFASGAQYNGHWQKNQYHGKGKYRWANGRSYEGDFEDSRMHGQGTVHDGKGRRWTGQFVNSAGPGLTYDLP